MKFQRRLSEPHIVLLQEQTSRWSLAGKWWRWFQPLSWSGFWESVMKLAVGSAEPVIERQCRDGQISYTIYDPSTQQEVTGLSETEVRVWLEQRYYH